VDEVNQSVLRPEGGRVQDSQSLRGGDGGLVAYAVAVCVVLLIMMLIGGLPLDRFPADPHSDHRRNLGDWLLAGRRAIVQASGLPGSRPTSTMDGAPIDDGVH
jgi:hypothetical protein